MLDCYTIAENVGEGSFKTNDSFAKRSATCSGLGSKHPKFGESIEMAERSWIDMWTNTRIKNEDCIPTLEISFLENRRPFQVFISSFPVLNLHTHAIWRSDGGRYLNCIEHFYSFHKKPMVFVELVLRNFYDLAEKRESQRRAKNHVRERHSNNTVFLLFVNI